MRALQKLFASSLLLRLGAGLGAVVLLAVLGIGSAAVLANTLPGPTAQWVRGILGAALFLTLAAVAVTLYHLHTELLAPLRELLRCTAAFRRGELAARTAYVGADELGQLGRAFNGMAEDLIRLQAEQAARVAAKTADLERSNRALNLLYQSIARVYNGPLARETYLIMLKDLENGLGAERGIACLVDEDRARARVLASTLRSEADPDFCRLSGCAECLRHRGVHTRRLGGRRVLTIPLQDAQRQHGVLQLLLPEAWESASWQQQLLDALSRHCGAAIGTARHHEQHRRLSLLEERSAIARELHDSVAQSLAYMRIQVARLEAAVRETPKQPTADGALAELGTELDTACRQLRGLLSTFRLKIEGGLGPALEQTVREFGGRGNLPITLDVRLAGEQLSPNEEIHLLQVLREALANVVHHARASRAQVTVHGAPDGTVMATVEDDGIGIRATPAAHHYGLGIMQERARSLHGTLAVEPRRPAGTRVILAFTPASRRTPRAATGRPR